LALPAWSRISTAIILLSCSVDRHTRASNRPRYAGLGRTVNGPIRSVGGAFRGTFPQLAGVAQRRRAGGPAAEEWLRRIGLLAS
jgi:hypothetical protein